ncbi:MAG: TolC family protein [Planctomycetes bacterium]|nr:TolC family protein [Planctomycetota bacterium]
MFLRTRSAFWLFGLAACHSYAPAPVDLDAHAREFAARVPDAATLRAFVPDEQADAIAAQIDLADGLDRAEGRLVAAALHPDCRLARRRVATAIAARDHSGAWQDPELQVSFERILEAVPYRWLAAASLGIGLPINGRLGAERAVADEQLLAAITDLRLAEEHAVAGLDAAWATWSAEQLRVTQLQGLCERLRELEAIARRLADAGANTELDARQFALERLRREGELAQHVADERLAALELNARLGLAPEATVAPRPDLGVHPALDDGAARAPRSPAAPGSPPPRPSTRSPSASWRCRSRSSGPTCSSRRAGPRRMASRAPPWACRCPCRCCPATTPRSRPPPRTAPRPPNAGASTSRSRATTSRSPKSASRPRASNAGS